MGSSMTLSDLSFMTLKGQSPGHADFKVLYIINELNEGLCYYHALCYYYGVI